MSNGVRTCAFGLLISLVVLGCGRAVRDGTSLREPVARPSTPPPIACRRLRVLPLPLTAESFLLLGEPAEVPADAESRVVSYGLAGCQADVPSVTVTELRNAERLTVTLLPLRTGPVCVVSSDDAVAVDGILARRIHVSACSAGFATEAALVGAYAGYTLHRLDAQTRLLQQDDLDRSDLQRAFTAADVERLGTLPAGAQLVQLHDPDPSFPFLIAVLAGPSVEYRVRRRDGTLARFFEAETPEGILVADDGTAEVLTHAPNLGCQRWALD